ncbi:hypothetical protein [Faecalicatena orotica]|uniref:alpha-L-rhamnosidase-related protein n=1 Tax=Faecalicatena orotica TaxID=1544 RepID=UPI0032177BF1
MLKIAKPVWAKSLTNEWNQFLGFFTEFDMDKGQIITIKIAARSYYRMFVNGEIIACGPARTAHGYCRVDEITYQVSGKVQIAVEVAALNKPEKYSNDCTLEPGLFACEVVDSKENVITATGDSSWKYQELLSRRSLVELMSHSRGIVEWYDLDQHSFDWRMGQGCFSIPIILEEQVQYLPRHAPLASLRPIPMETLEEICDRIPAEGSLESLISLAKHINPDYYQLILKENFFLESLRMEKDTAFTGQYKLDDSWENLGKAVTIRSGNSEAAVTFGREKSELGFIDFTIEVENECCVDVINSDHLHISGELKSNTYVTRYCLQPGRYHLTSFEPKLTRYIKVILRTVGTVKMSYPVLLDYSYDDKKECFFSCNDGELNAIYEASRRTLRLDTLDIFMDCPERERGGWLCDSHFSSQGAWQMFGDLSVERDFIENFMLTDGSQKWKGFFPEVYPASKPNQETAGIMTWSFWLMTELFDFYKRSGDRAFIDACKERVSCFIQGLLSLRGESGLLEGLTVQFVDWSHSNCASCLEPINIPNNCLAVCMLEKMADLYGYADWKREADEMRSIINAMDCRKDLGLGNGDSASVVDGQLRRGDCMTEAGAAYEIWSGFHLKDKAYMDKFVNYMGYSPKYRSDPNVGKANLFIGIILRFDILARLGKIDTLVREIKNIYLEELRDGSGTFFENYNAFSGCHGVNGFIGALLTNMVLGLGQPHELTKTIKLMPHPCGLNWARGSAKCSDGMIFMNYKADYEEHVMEIMLHMPENWKYKFEIPFELLGWKILLNGKVVGKEKGGMS